MSTISFPMWPMASRSLLALLPPIMMEGIWRVGGFGSAERVSREITGVVSISHLKRTLSPSKRGL
jgi:hypothetical protein